MNQAKKCGPHGPLDNGFSVHPKEFVFFDKKTGTRRFEVKGSEDEDISMDQAVNMLAIYCVARHQMPRDFTVMVLAGEEIVDDLVRRTTKLMRTCSGAMTRLPLSKRQYQVLSGIAQALSNKEIATRLNISERTVKFHVSAMLEKFGVRGRAGLMLEAGDWLAAEEVQRREENPECPAVLGDAALALTSPIAKSAPHDSDGAKSGTLNRAKNRPAGSWLAKSPHRAKSTNYTAKEFPNLQQPKDRTLGQMSSGATGR